MSLHVLPAKNFIGYLLGDAVLQKRLEVMAEPLGLGLSGPGLLKPVSPPLAFVRIASDEKHFIELLSHLVQAPGFSEHLEGIITMKVGADFNETFHRIIYYLEIRRTYPPLEESGSPFGALSLTFLNLSPEPALTAKGSNVSTYFSVVERPHPSGIYGA